MNTKTAIMGFGNPVRSDDGIGCYVIDKLKSIAGNKPDLTLLDMGTSAFEVLYQLEGHDKILIVDAVVNTGEPVGTLYKVPAKEVLRVPDNDPMVFLHSLKWDQALSYAKKMLGENYPENIQVFLIAVDNTRLEVDLSPEVKAAGDKVVQLMLDDLNKAPEISLELKAAHLIIPHEIANTIFEEESTVFVAFNTESQTLLVSPKSNVWFSKLHKSLEILLKDKDLMGTKSVCIRELQIDHELDQSDKKLSCEVNKEKRFLKIKFDSIA